MPQGSTGEPHAGVRKFLRYSWIAVGVAALFAGWTIFSRWQENRHVQQEAIENKRARDQRAYEFLGGDRFEILHFYASPGVIRRGDTTELCYGVSNAKAVRLEQQAARVWPSANRCMEVAPVKDTTYTLTAEDAAGQTKTATLTVQVR